MGRGSKADPSLQAVHSTQGTNPSSREHVGFAGWWPAGAGVGAGAADTSLSRGAARAKCSGVSAPSRRALKIGRGDVHLGRPQLIRAKNILEPLNNSSQIQIDFAVHLRASVPLPSPPACLGTGTEWRRGIGWPGLWVSPRTPQGSPMTSGTAGTARAGVTCVICPRPVSPIPWQTLDCLRVVLAPGCSLTLAQAPGLLGPTLWGPRARSGCRGATLLLRSPELCTRPRGRLCLPRGASEGLCGERCVPMGTAGCRFQFRPRPGAGRSLHLSVPFSFSGVVGWGLQNRPRVGARGASAPSPPGAVPHPPPA
ncbi:endonuclease V isoform X4 [Sciurus carolinensis]|uniref:endonuclease V isoform X4 n=1 Tax=Sciurus carolinensis TaxID=30640 RepID=UPI001FB54D8A|nr:endonuclease V isoform X4 [Sciurus carolinensis]XP_047401162.1 endonuclease V isoform X4 [Sciurus carolinensis]XP_047401163.1 endonuclease V isoform X4 [Sciurus carolinensis]